MVCKRRMPKAMSDWIDERIRSGQTEKVHLGYAMKSNDCTIVFYSNWNCDSQFNNIVRKLK